MRGRGIFALVPESYVYSPFILFVERKGLALILEFGKGIELDVVQALEYAGIYVRVAAAESLYELFYVLPSGLPLHALRQICRKLARARYEP